MGERKRKEKLGIKPILNKIPRKSDGWVGFNKKDLKDRFGDYMAMFEPAIKNGDIELIEIGDIVYTRMIGNLLKTVKNTIEDIKQMDPKDIKYSDNLIKSIPVVFHEEDDKFFN